jgi:hypothetical protein
MLVRIFPWPIATVKMVNKSGINETYSLMNFSILSLCLSLLHGLKPNCIQLPDISERRQVKLALGNIATRLESPKIVGIG